MHAANAARGEDRDAGGGGDQHGCGDGCAAGLARGEERGDVPPRGFGDRPALAKRIDLPFAQAHAQLAADDRDGGGNSPVGAHDRLDIERGPAVVG